MTISMLVRGIYVSGTGVPTNSVLVYLKKKSRQKSLWWNIFLKAEFLPLECGRGLI